MSIADDNFTEVYRSKVQVFQIVSMSLKGHFLPFYFGMSSLFSELRGIAMDQCQAPPCCLLYWREGVLQVVIWCDNGEGGGSLMCDITFCETGKYISKLQIIPEVLQIMPRLFIFKKITGKN